MKKLLSALTSFALTVVCSAPLLTNAIAPAPNYKGDINIDSVLSDAFGEKYIVEYWPSNMFYFVMSPESFGSVSPFGAEMTVKLKNSSELDENGLKDLVCQNSAKDVTCYKSDSDDNTYIFDFDSDVADFLSKCDDVVSIKKNNLFAVDCSNLYNYAIMVSNDVDFDYDKYSDYIADDSTIADLTLPNDPNYILLRSPSVDCFYEDMYNTYLNLQKDYGEENVFMSCEVLESSEPETQSIIEDVYTALIGGDANGDAEVDISDVLAITAYVVNPADNHLKELGVLNADVNGDGAVTANDALAIQQYLANVITEL